jgi:hypothetical protein
VIELEEWRIPILLRRRLPQAKPWSRQGHGSISVLLPLCLHMSHNEMTRLVGPRTQAVVVPVLAGDHTQWVSMEYTVSHTHRSLASD